MLTKLVILIILSIFLIAQADATRMEAMSNAIQGKPMKHPGLDAAKASLQKTIDHAKSAVTITKERATGMGQPHAIISTPKGTLTSFFDRTTDTTHEYWIEGMPILEETGYIFYEPKNKLHDSMWPAYKTPGGRVIYNPPRINTGNAPYHQELVNMLIPPPPPRQELPLVI